MATTKQLAQLASLVRVKRLMLVNSDGRRIGEDHHRAKLSNADIELIIALRFEHGLSYGVIAAKMDHIPGGIAKTTVRDICIGRIRSQVPHGTKVCG